MMGVAPPAMWRSWLTHQSGNPEVVGLSPAGGEKLAVGQTFSGQSYKRFVPLAMNFTPTRLLKWVPSNLWIVSVSDSVICPCQGSILAGTAYPFKVDTLSGLIGICMQTVRHSLDKAG